MFIAFFKNNNPLFFFLIPVIALVLWIPSFSIHPTVVEQNPSLLFGFISATINRIPYLNSVIAFLTLILEAFYINFVINKNEITERRTFLPSLVYIVLMSIHPSVMVFNSSLIANFFVLIFLQKIFATYRKENANSEMFDAGFSLCIASLFYFPLVVLFPVLWVGLIIFRAINFREWLILLIAVTLPYFFIFTYYFWNNSVVALKNYISSFFYFTEKPFFEFYDLFYFTIVSGGLILLLSLFKLSNSFINASQKDKKNLLVIIWFFVFSILSIFIAPSFLLPCFSLLVVGITVFVVNYFFNSKKIWWSEILFLSFLISVLMNNYSGFFEQH